MAVTKPIDGLMKWAGREEWREGIEETFALHLGPACSQAGVQPDDVKSLIGEGLFANLWGCIFEDFLTREDADGRNVVDDYLKRRGWKESAPHKTYLAGLRASVMSLYEVSDIVPGQSCVMRDLIRGGEPVRVSERSGTRSLKPWDRLAARVVSVRTTHVLGGGILVFRHELCEEILESLRPMQRKGRRETRRPAGIADRAAAPVETGAETTLRSSAPSFTTIWLADALGRVLNRRMPELRNSDGDELLFTTMRYPLAPGVTTDKVRDALDTAPALYPADDRFWNWVGESDRKTARARAGQAGMVMNTMPGGGLDGDTVLGNVELDREAVTLSVNSAARAERGREMIAPVLAGLVGAPVTETQTVDDLMASPSKPAENPSPALLPQEARAVTWEFMDRHYAGVLDEKLARLGNRTPRQAARTAQGRESLVAWLKQIENESAKRDPDDAMFGYDFGWMWETLGIAELRR